jgi:hypothetical protein
VARTVADKSQSFVAADGTEVRIPRHCPLADIARLLDIAARAGRAALGVLTA